MKTGKLKERTLKLIIKHDEGRDTLLYAEPGTGVTWEGGSNEGYEDCYGGRRLLWCRLKTGESVGLEESEVEWDEAE